MKHDILPLEKYMKTNHVPGVCVALLSDEKITIQCAGQKLISRHDDPVMANTLFQAASISKTVAAFAMIAWCRENDVALDIPLVDITPSFPFPLPETVTLAGLLSHTAGYTVHGFPGYRNDRQAIPNIVDIIKGKHSNTPAIKCHFKTGQFRYSGGGYTLAQHWVEKVSGQSLEAIAKHYVFEPFSMEHSSYAIRTTENNNAFGHSSGGRKVAYGWHLYPESAAAGLWTTAEDLVKFAKGFIQDYHRDKTGIARTMLSTPVCRDKEIDYGLGVEIFSPEGFVGHDGWNHGFRARLRINLDKRTALAVMTNGEGGGNLLDKTEKQMKTLIG